MNMKASLTAATLIGVCATSVVNAAEPVRFDRFRAYLIYEDSGKLSKNIAKRTDQIVANDENGSSVQVLVDIVASGGKNQVYDNNTLLLTWVTDPFAEMGTPSKVDMGWPITYVGLNGEVTRSIIVDHDCGPFTLHARVDVGDSFGKEYVKEFNLTCGD